jgi:hypothetical protein
MQAEKPMSRFIAVHTMPMTEEKLLALLEGMPPLPDGIVWRRSYCNFAESRLFCEWEAGDQRTLAQVFAAGGIPFDSIHPVRLLDVQQRAFVD